MCHDLAVDAVHAGALDPAISLVEQPSTYSEAFNVQRFQASLSFFTVIWNFLAASTFIFWVLFYVR